MPAAIAATQAVQHQMGALTAAVGILHRDCSCKPLAARSPAVKQPRLQELEHSQRIEWVEVINPPGLPPELEPAACRAYRRGRPNENKNSATAKKTALAGARAAT